MNDLHWPLTVLVKSVQYKNMTAAAHHIGISQSQISRLMTKIEQSLGITLLDKTSPRNTTWTPEAQSVAQIYQKTTLTLEKSLQEIGKASFPDRITIGSLEGLSFLAKSYAKHVLDHTSLTTALILIYDQNEMEAKYNMGELDIIFTSRLPSNKKSNQVYHIGHQTFETFKDDNKLKVLSPFEAVNDRRGKSSKYLISNSLEVRKNWLSKYSGTGVVPSRVTKNKAKGTSEVLAVGQEYLHSTLWSNMIIATQSEL